MDVCVGPVTPPRLPPRLNLQFFSVFERDSVKRKFDEICKPIKIKKIKVIGPPLKRKKKVAKRRRRKKKL